MDLTPIREASDAPIGSYVVEVDPDIETGTEPEFFLVAEATGETLDSLLVEFPGRSGSVWTPIDEESSRTIARWGPRGWFWSL